MKQAKMYTAAAIFLYGACSYAGDITIPISHLQESKMTNGYTKALVIELKGYIKVGNVAVKSQISSRLSPAQAMSADGKPLLKVDMLSQAVAEGEKSDSRGYNLLNPETFEPVKTVMADGEVTLYRMVKDYPAMMRVGAKELISKSDSFDSKSLKVPSYRTYEVLTLERVNGETDLYELCETDYEYGKDSGYKKVQSESSSCFIINRQGELKGYAMLMVNAKSRATYQGTIYAE